MIDTLFNFTTIYYMPPVLKTIPTPKEIAVYWVNKRKNS